MIGYLYINWLFRISLLVEDKTLGKVEKADFFSRRKRNIPLRFRRIWILRFLLVNWLKDRNSTQSHCLRLLLNENGYSFFYNFVFEHPKNCVTLFLWIRWFQLIKFCVVIKKGYPNLNVVAKEVRPNSQYTFYVKIS